MDILHWHRCGYLFWRLSKECRCGGGNEAKSAPARSSVGGQFRPLSRLNELPTLPTGTGTIVPPVEGALDYDEGRGGLHDLAEGPQLAAAIHTMRKQHLVTDKE